MNECRSCRAPIVWAVTAAGKRIPLDALPVPREGAVLAASRNEQGALEVRSVTPVDSLWDDEHPAISHFATCPNATAHRKASR